MPFRVTHGSSVHRDRLWVAAALGLAMIVIPLPQVAGAPSVAMAQPPAANPSTTPATASTHASATASFEACGLEDSPWVRCTGAARTSAPAVGEGWLNLTPDLPESPPGRAGAMMTYDGGDGYLLMFGGVNDSRPYGVGDNDTWAYSAGRWTELHPLRSPPLLAWGGMVYDPAAGFVFLYGGEELTPNDVLSASNQSWAYHAGVWTNLSPSLSIFPRARDDFAFAYDPAIQAVLLFGGCCRSSDLAWADTWEFSQGVWSQLSPATSPPGRDSASMAYSNGLGALVLFGGGNATSGSPPGEIVYNDTWEYRSGTWANVTPTLSPPQRFASSLVPLDEAGDLLLFGGGNQTVVGGFNDTWVFSNGTWSQVPTAPHPLPGEWASTAIDPQDGYVLLFGGSDTPTPLWKLLYPSNETWAFGPPVLGRPVVTPNPSDLGEPVGFDEPYTNRTAPYTVNWTLSDGTESSAQSFDHTFAEVGDYRVNVSVRDVAGEYNNSSAEVIVNPLPSVAIQVSLHQTDVGIPVGMSATATNGSAPFSWNWTLGDNTTANTSTVVHSYRAPGLYNVTARATDRAGIVRTASTGVTVVPLPNVSLAAATVLDLGQPLPLATEVANGTAPFTYIYQGLPPGCATASVPGLVCDPTRSGNFSVRVQVRDGVGGETNSSEDLVEIFPALVISATGVAPAIDLGQNFTFSVSIGSPGSGSDRLTYDDLPSGCGTPTFPVYTCTPSVTGNFTIIVQVTDASNASALSLPVSLTVNPPLGVRFVADPSRLTQGGTLNLEAETTGGTAPFAYGYSGLPEGCSPADLPSVGCIPSTPGNYSVQAKVTDATGAHQYATVTVAVVAPSPFQTPPPGPFPFGDVAIAIGVAAAMAAILAITVWRRRGHPPSSDPSTGRSDNDRPAG
jgi:chitodextrinase